MARVTFDVPTIAQEKTMCCWHTSAMMIWQYWQQKTGRQGPMNTLGPVYEANTGLSVHAFITLGEKTSLKALDLKNTYSNGELYALLKQCGPLWCAGYWYGAGHVVVLSGVDEGTVFINDPDRGVKKEGTIAWFNEKLARADGALRYKDSEAY
jgi:ABC-type bacteriocin/lantibiotic exporter with double-glycine peptidase domain